VNVADHIQMLQQQSVAPQLVEKVADEEDLDALAEVCAELEPTVREACQERGLSKHAGMAACYMVVNRLSNPETVGQGEQDG
jgi:hypothetical protein